MEQWLSVRRNNRKLFDFFNNSKFFYWYMPFSDLFPIQLLCGARGTSIPPFKWPHNYDINQIFRLYTKEFFYGKLVTTITKKTYLKGPRLSCQEEKIWFLRETFLLALRDSPLFNYNRFNPFITFPKEKEIKSIVI